MSIYQRETREKETGNERKRHEDKTVMHADGAFSPAGMFSFIIGI